MDAQAFSEWMTSLSISERISALALIYSSLTVYTRELFLPERVSGREPVALEKLHGLNEIHHTLSHQLVAYATNDKYAYSIDGLCQRLLDNTNRYHIEFFLDSAVEFARTHIPPPGQDGRA